MTKLKIIGKKNRITKLFIQLNQLIKADGIINSKLITEHSKNILEAKESVWFLNFYGVLDLLYLEMVGLKRDEVYSLFKTTNYDDKDLPCAWYKGKNSNPKIGSILGPEGFRCFIPDCIDDLAISKADIGAKKKCELAFRMFNDLIKQQNKFLKDKKKLKAKQEKAMDFLCAQAQELDLYE